MLSSVRGAQWLDFIRRRDELRLGLLRSTTAEPIRVKRHKFPDTHRRPSSQPLHAIRQPVVPTRSVQLRHRHQMPDQVLLQSYPFQLPFPILRPDVNVRDLTVQCIRVLLGDAANVLRPRTSKFIYPTQVRLRVSENGSNHTSDISRRNRIGFSLPKRQFDAASLADARTG